MFGYYSLTHRRNLAVNTLLGVFMPVFQETRLLLSAFVLLYLAENMMPIFSRVNNSEIMVQLTVAFVQAYITAKSCEPT